MAGRYQGAEAQLAETQVEADAAHGDELDASDRNADGLPQSTFCLAIGAIIDRAEFVAEVGQHMHHLFRQLVMRGRDPASLTSLADLVTIDAFKDGLRFFLDRRGGQSSSMIADLACTLKAVARHHVRVES